MIKRYLYTIGKYLSPSQREEVLKEIEANLYDYLEENYGTKDYSDEAIESAIRAMGHPKTVAEAYLNSPRSLVGAAYIDAFWLVVKIALIGTAIGITIGNILEFSPSDNGIQLFVKLFTDIWQSSFATLGMVTAIFALIQHYSPSEETNNRETWSLEILDKAPERYQKVSIVELAIETFFICLGLVVINQTSPYLAFSVRDNIVVPLINMSVFQPFVIWITLVLIGSLAVNVYLLIRRSWQTTTRIISVGLDIIGVIIVTKMALTPEIWDIKSLADRIGESGENTATWFNLTINITLAVLVIVSAFDIYGHIKAIFRRQSFTDEN